MSTARAKVERIREWVKRGAIIFFGDASCH